MVLQSGAVLLRPWRVEDARWYVEARDEEVYHWTTERRTLTVDEAEEAIAQISQSVSGFSFAIVEVANQQLAGNLALVLDKEDPKCAEVMYWLAPQARGRGIASEAVRLACQWAFATQGLERVTLQTYAGNVRSQRLAQRLGFQDMAQPPESGAHDGRVWFVLNSGIDTGVR